MMPLGSRANSTQLPLGLLWLLFVHLTPRGSVAGTPLVTGGIFHLPSAPRGQQATQSGHNARTDAPDDNRLHQFLHRYTTFSPLAVGGIPVNHFLWLFAYSMRPVGITISDRMCTFA